VFVREFDHRVPIFERDVMSAGAQKEPELAIYQDRGRRQFGRRDTLVPRVDAGDRHSSTRYNSRGDDRDDVGA